jgi:transcriptional regulator with GAF, ATPase, and Fis domain
MKDGICMRNVNQIFDLTSRDDYSNLLDTIWDRPFNEFTCDYCGQLFSKEFSKISVFLHGIIFLLGKEAGYLGFTCANCRKTLLFQGTGTDISMLNKELHLGCFDFDGDLDLAYFSSVNYYPSQIPGLNNFDIKCSEYFIKNSLTWISEDSYLHPIYPPEIHYECIDRRPDTKQNYFCSEQNLMNDNTYFFIGFLATSWWFKEEEIIKLCDLENSENLRIFPRYVSHQFSDLAAIENYCWKHKIYMDLLKTHFKLKKFWDEESERSEKRVMHVPPSNEDEEIPMEFEMGEKIPMYSIEADIIKEKIRKKYDLSQIAELAQILIAPKKYWEPKESVDIHPCIEYWGNAVGLFKSSIYTDAVKGFMPDDIAAWKKEQIEFHEITKKVQQNFHEKFVQDFLLENHESFIESYTKLVQSKEFTYANVWQLKEKLLHELYSCILANEQNTFPVANNINLADDSIIASNLEKNIKDYKSDISAFKDIISQDPKIYEILRDIYIFASNTINTEFLLEGETGTGKELFAKAIHAASPCLSESEGIRHNCAAIPEKLFESTIFGITKDSGVPIEKDSKGKLKQADNSTMFFDEIGELPLKQQAKLLRTLQEREIEPVGGKTTKINTTFIFATNVDIEDKVKKGEFREDFYYRIDTHHFKIPPLRERLMDIPLLLDHFIEKNSKDFNMEKLFVPDECIYVLCQYNWPGNVRELEKKIKKIMIRRKGKKDFSELRVSEFDLPPMESKNILENNSTSSFDNIDLTPADGKRKMPSKENLEKLLKKILEEQNGNPYGIIKKAAVRIGVDPTSLSREMKELGIKLEDLT